MWKMINSLDIAAALCGAAWGDVQTRQSGLWDLSAQHFRYIYWLDNCADEDFRASICLNFKLKNKSKESLRIKSGG